jgi:hypothetical protein
VADEWSAQQVGRKPCDRRLAAALEAGNEDENRLARVGILSSNGIAHGFSLQTGVTLT